MDMVIVWLMIMVAIGHSFYVEEKLEKLRDKIEKELEKEKNPEE